MSGTAIELTLQVDDEDVEDFICHLYYAGIKYSFCGLHDSQDPHCQMHHDHKQVSPQWGATKGPGEGCPVCGAPICPECKRLLA